MGYGTSGPRGTFKLVSCDDDWMKALMRKMENDEPKRQVRPWRPWERADHNFTVISVALMVFFLVAGFGAWILNGSGAAAVNARPASSSIR
jgi:hypothetical protein